MAGTKLTGVLHIVCGIIIIAIYAIIIGVKVPFYYIGAGIWGGIFCVATGAVGVVAARSDSRGMHGVSLIMGILAFLCALTCTCLAAFVFYYLLNIHPDRHQYMPMFQVYLAFNSLFFIFSFVDLAVSLFHIKTSYSGMSEATSHYGTNKNVRQPAYGPGYDSAYPTGPPPSRKY